MDNNVVVERAMKFVWITAVNAYQEGRVLKPVSIFGRKYVYASFTVREPKDGKVSIHINDDFKAKYKNAFKATIWVDKNRDVLKDIKKRCLDQGIEYKHHKPKKESVFEEEFVTLSVPIYLVQKEIERRDAEVRAFQDVLKTRRKDVVDALTNAIIQHPNANTITSGGLSYHDGDSSWPILSFSDLGLESLDSGDKVEALAQAVAANLNNRNDDHYIISRNESGGFEVYTTCSIYKEYKPPEKVELSKW